MTSVNDSSWTSIAAVLDSVRGSRGTSSDSRTSGASSLPDAKARNASRGLRSTADLWTGSLANAAAYDTGPGRSADGATVGARVRTLDRARPYASAVVWSQGTIVAVDSDTEDRERCDSWTYVIAAGGCALVPGLVDGHFRQRRAWLELFPFLTTRRPEKRHPHPIKGRCRRAGDWAPRQLRSLTNRRVGT